MGLWTFLHVPAHMITVGDFQSDWRKCNPIKSSKVNGDGKKHRSVPEVFLAASPLVASASGQKCVGLQPTPKIPAARKKNLWYPGYQSGGILSNYTAHVSFSINHL